MLSTVLPALRSVFNLDIKMLMHSFVINYRDLLILVP